jgi:hypothetical protein
MATKAPATGPTAENTYTSNSSAAFRGVIAKQQLRIISQRDKRDAVWELINASVANWR